MGEADEARRPRTSVALLAAGALATVVGALLPFQTLTVRAGEIEQSESIQGLDTPEGRIFLVVGAALFVAAFLLWNARSRWSRLAALLLGGLLAVFVFGTALLTIGEASGEKGLSDEPPLAPAVANDFDRLGITLDARAGPGLYLVVAGGSSALVGSIAASVYRRRPR